MFVSSKDGTFSEQKLEGENCLEAFLSGTKFKGKTFSAIHKFLRISKATNRKDVKGTQFYFKDFYEMNPLFYAIYKTSRHMSPF